ncbi:hypothetical protein [Microvirga pudoricolor]|uniref:hypothetical protein n=1 Tax=Microvirga pudoricolor TaxID=2778729 RepID=UPI0019506BB6|nr:hypothetical protein [Microvirga pudoricolor]MBM6595653.1 hypothetical protein [Microvirga pudoricolor]
MSALAPVKRLLRDVAEMERRFIGARALVSPERRRRIRRALGIAPRPSPRRFIPASLGVSGFFEELRRRQIRYAVLRWFEALPHVEPGEDIDLLVADADLPRLAELLDSEEGAVPCDVYTASALPGTSYRGTSYLPPARARALLERAQRQGELVLKPCADDHFLSLSYHAVYQKGLSSGLPTVLPDLTPTATPEHPYGEILQGMAQRLAIPVRITMEELDDYLETRGWRPEAEMLDKLAEHNVWLKRRLSR